MADNADDVTKRLQYLIDQAIAIQQAATQLLVDLTDQLQRSIGLHNDTVDRRRHRRGEDRRKKPR